MNIVTKLNSLLKLKVFKISKGNYFTKPLRLSSEIIKVSGVQISGVSVLLTIIAIII